MNWAAAAAAIAGLALLARGGVGGVDSSLEDGEATQMSADGIDPRLAVAVGLPFSWGAGTPSTPLHTGEVSSLGPDDAPAGFDCSGLVQAALVALGLLSPTERDRSAAALWAAGVAVSDDVRVGDVAGYSSNGRTITHVAIAGADADGSGVAPVLSASGGYSDTFGDDPDAAVKVWSSPEYRSDFVGWRRLA